MAPKNTSDHSPSSDDRETKRKAEQKDEDDKGGQAEQPPLKQQKLDAGQGADSSKAADKGGSGSGSSGGDTVVDAKKLDSQQQKDDRKLKGDDTEQNKSADGSDESSEVRWHVTETGFIYFFYRPKVQPALGSDKAATDSLDGVQNSFMLLVPRRSEADTAPAKPKDEKDDDDDDNNKDKREPPNPTGYRFIALGRKRLPDVELALSHGQEPRGIGGRDSEATWATIGNIGTDLQQLMDGMKENRYSTKTRGERVQPAARPAGRGHYLLSIKQTDPPSKREVRLTYHLSHPSEDEFGDVQKELGIHPSSSVLLQMRNPTMPPTGPEAPTAGLPEESRAKLTDKEMQENFGGDTKSGGNRYARPEDPELLDRQGVELLVIKRRKQEEEGLQGAGDEQIDALKDIASRDAERTSDEEVLEELKLTTKDAPVEALSGDWI